MFNIALIPNYYFFLLEYCGHPVPWATIRMCVTRKNKYGKNVREKAIH